MPEPNPNRDINAEQVVHLFAKNLPHMLDGLHADREWLWWAGDKPSDEERKTLLELGFRFTPRPHALADGSTGHWYHACGGAVYRRRGAHTEQAEKRPARRSRVAQPSAAPRNRVAADEIPRSEAYSDLERLADRLS